MEYWCRCTLNCVLPLFVVFCSVGGVCCSNSQYGREFIVAFPFGSHPHPVSTSQSTLKLVLTTPSSSDVRVKMKQDGEGAKQLDIKDNVLERSFNSTGMLPPNGTALKQTIHLESTDNFGVLVQGTVAYDGYLALPVSQWGSVYRVAGYCQGPNSTCQLVILAHQSNTQVTVTLPAENNIFRVEDVGTAYSGEVTLTETLAQNEAWVIPKGYELSGALVKSSKAVGVLAGAQWTNYNGSEGTVTEQLPPLTSLGQEYVSLGMGTVRVVTTEPKTTVHTTDTPSVLLDKEGQWMQQFWPKPVYIRANRPVLVVQVSKLPTSTSASSHPVFTVLTPVIQFLKPRHTVIVPRSHLLAVTRKKYKTLVQYGASNLAAATPSSSAEAIRSDYVVDVVPEVGGLKMSSPSAQVVGLYIQRVEPAAVHLSPLAAHYAEINPLRDCTVTTQQKPGDTIDNDCDGQVDEDDCSSGSPATGIDCAVPNADNLTTWGRNFVLVIPDYYNMSTVNFSLALTTLSSSGPVATAVGLPDGTWKNHSFDSSLKTTLISIPTFSTNMQLASDKSSKAIQISSDKKISVVVYASNPPGDSQGGAMKLIPERALGREYYVVTICPTKACRFQVASVHDQTSISIHLRLMQTPNANVTFQGCIYTDGDVIRVNVSSYEALQLECTALCNMTGTLVVASKPVAVFFMSDAEKLHNWYKYASKVDYFMEQLPPVETYGREFLAMQQSDRIPGENNCNLSTVPADFCNDVVWILSSEVRTSVEVFNGSHSCPHFLDRAGDLLNLVMEGQVMHITSDRPVLVVQFLKTLKANDGALLVVPAVSQYVGEDIIRFRSQTAERQVVVYMNGTQTQQVSVNGQQRPVDGGEVKGPLFTMVYLLLNYSAGQAEQTELRMAGGGQFGGYVSELGKQETIFPLSYRLDPVNLGCLVTKPTRADGIDNDCDGNIDEESCPQGSEQDDDRDGRFNEDCDKLPRGASSPIDTKPGSRLCGCNCKRTDLETRMSPESLTSVLNSIVKELSVNKKELSSVRRKKISAEDDRPSAQTVGYFGVAIIIAIALGIIILDAGALYRDVQRLVELCRRPERT